jgi:integrase
VGILESEEKMVDIPKHTSKLSVIVDFYLHSDAFCRLSGNTQKDYEKHLDAVLKTTVEGRLLGNYTVRSIKARHIRLAYAKWLIPTGDNKKDKLIRTANYRKAALSKAWKHCMELDVMDNDPIRLVKTLSTKQRKVKWTREQVVLFLDTAYGNFRWRSIGLIVHMAYEWAQRIGDMRMLTWNHINFDAKRVDLTQSKRGADVHLPIPSDLLTMLKQQSQDFGFQDYVAPKTKPVAGAYVPYPIDHIDTAINEVKQEAGLPKEITAMDLRRTAITEMVEGDADLAQIMQVSGHRNPESVKPYLVNTFSGASNALSKRNKT